MNPKPSKAFPVAMGLSCRSGCATLCLKLIYIRSLPSTFNPRMIFSITGTFLGSVPALPETAPLTSSPHYRFSSHFCSSTDFYCTFFKCFFLSPVLIFPIISAKTIFIRKTPQQQFSFPASLVSFGNLPLPPNF